MAWTTVPGSECLEQGHAMVFEHDGRRVAICRAEGGVYAIDDLCTHDGGPLGEGELEGNRITCPRHGAQFDITSGRAVTLPAVRGVKTYPARQSDGAIEVELP